MIFAAYIPANAVNKDKLEIKFQIGSSKLVINGKDKKITKPYVLNNVVFVPLIPIVEAYGAEINNKGKGKINLVYRDITVDIVTGNKNYTVNDSKRNLTAAPASIKGEIMVPANLITDNFGGKLSYDKSKKSYTLVLDDDGAISDFSAIIGSIGKPRVGNSHFNWTINIPKGSQIVSTSFSSKSVSIENMQNELSIDVDVGLDEGKKLEDIAKDIKDKKDEYNSEFPGKVLDVYVNTSVSPQCVEVLGNIYGKGATLQRIILVKGLKYKVSVSSLTETNAKKIKDKPVLMGIVNSFKLGYTGSIRDVYDISKVKPNKMASFTDSLYGFSMDVFPEWDVIKNFLNYNSSDSYSLRVGAGYKEYISISPENVGKIEDIDEYLNDIKTKNEALYNPKYYSFIEKQTIDLQKYKIYKLVYSLQYKENKYIFEDNYIMEGNVLFDIGLKCPEAKYLKEKDKFKTILETIKYDPKFSEDDIKKMLSSSENTKALSKIGNDDKLTDFESKDSKWKLKIPGYWTIIPDYEDISTIFYNESTQTYIGIETVKNNSSNRSMEDEAKFELIKSSAEDEESTKFIEKKDLSEKGINVKLYYFRYENSGEELYSDVYYYVIDNNDYSYCFMYMLPDVFASEKNIKEIKGIWDSFITIK
jgi:hypothetical protein